MRRHRISAAASRRRNDENIITAPVKPPNPYKGDGARNGICAMIRKKSMLTRQWPGVMMKIILTLVTIRYFDDEIKTEIQYLKRRIIISLKIIDYQASTRYLLNEIYSIFYIISCSS